MAAGNGVVIEQLGRRVSNLEQEMATLRGEFSSQIHSLAERVDARLDASAQRLHQTQLAQMQLQQMIIDQIAELSARQSAAHERISHEIQSVADRQTELLISHLSELHNTDRALTDRLSNLEGRVYLAAALLTIIISALVSYLLS